MLKKMLVAAMAVMALAAVVAPNASATWTHNHQAIPAGTNPEETFTGTAQFQGLVGKVHCSNTEGKVQLLGGQTTATIKLFQSQNPAACHVSGALGTSCGTNSLQKVELQTHATGHIATHNGVAAITITHIKLLNQFGSCASTVLESDETGRDVTLVPNDPTTITTGTLTGTLKTAAGNVAVSGTLHAHVPNTYGIVVH
jgi:hypothetical protein